MKHPPGFKGLDKDDFKTRWESFKFWDLVHLISEIYGNSIALAHCIEQLLCVVCYVHVSSIFSYYVIPGKGVIQWDYIHGLAEFAIYGGRVDNTFDVRVMVSYLKQLFDPNLLSDQNRGNKKLGPLKMPTSTNHRVGWM